jgi:hypothetical protein
MKTVKNLSLSLLLAATGLVTSCGGGSGGGGSVTGENGAAPSASARTTPITVGDSDCPNGGVLVESGIDENQNGLLDDNEVDDSQKVCNGLNSHNSLIALNQESAGANCPYGGVRIDSGLDSNDNGTLDSGEVDNSEYVCNQIDGSVGWQVATLVETSNTGSAFDPQVSFDTNGNALAVWLISNGTVDDIWSSKYTTTEGWGNPALIETNSGDARNVQLSIDTSGNALAVWVQNDGTYDNIWANRYTVNTGWGSPERIDGFNGNADEPQISVDANGNGIAVWHQYEGSITNIWANRFMPGFGWGSAVRIESDNLGNAYSPDIDFDSGGNAIAVWQQSDGAHLNNLSNRYTLESGWGTAELIETDNAGNARPPQISVNDSGDALAVWGQSDGTRYNIWANRYSAGTGWDTAQLIETNDISHAYAPKVSIGANGNAVAVWHQRDGSRSNIWSNHYRYGIGWGSAQLIETDNAGGATNPQISIDANGNGLAVWRHFDGTRTNIWSNRFTLGVGWSNAELIETDNAGWAENPQISIDAYGNGLAVWHQSDGSLTNIWSNFWAAP